MVNVIGLYGPVTTCLLFCNCDKGFGLERFCFYVAKNSCGFAEKIFHIEYLYLCDEAYII